MHLISSIQIVKTSFREGMSRSFFGWGRFWVGTPAQAQSCYLLHHLGASFSLRAVPSDVKSYCIRGTSKVDRPYALFLELSPHPHPRPHAQLRKLIHASRMPERGNTFCIFLFGFSYVEILR